MSGMEILAFSGAIFLLAISPGPGLLAVISKSISSGFKEASLMVAGIVTGDLIFLNFAIFGLSSLSTMEEDFFSVLKYLGGAYLVYLGIETIISTQNKNSLFTKNSSYASSLGSYFTGLAITLSNPKVILFYLGFLPSFMDMSRIAKLDILIISIVIAFVLGAVMIVYAYMASNAFGSFANHKTARVVSGLGLIGVGLFILLR